VLRCITSILRYALKPSLAEIWVERMRGVFTHRGPDSSSEYGLGSRSSESSVSMTEPGLGVRYTEDQKAMMVGDWGKRPQRPHALYNNSERSCVGQGPKEAGTKIRKVKPATVREAKIGRKFNLSISEVGKPRCITAAAAEGWGGAERNKRASREGDPSVNHQTPPFPLPSSILVIARVPRRTPAREPRGCRQGHP